MLEREDLRQVRSVIKDVLREGQLDKLPDLFGREHHKHRGTHDLTFKQLVDAPDYIDNRQFITIVNEDEDGVAFIDLLGTDHQIVVTKNPHDFTLSLDSQLHVYSDEEQPYIRISNLSDTLALDPALQFGLGPLDLIQFTVGVDDSDSDKLKIANLSALGTLAEAQGSFGEILVFFHENDENLCYVDLGDFSTDGIIYNGTGGSGEGQFSNPRCVAYDGIYIYVADDLNGRIQKFDMASGLFVAKLAVRRPWGICHWDGFLYTMTNTTDGSGQYQLHKINASTMAMDTTYNFDAGSADDEFSGPRGVSTDGTNLYICETGNSRIKKTSMAGVYVAKVGSSGAGNGQFGGSSPVDCEVDGSYVYACDYGNKRIQIFDVATMSYQAQHATQTFGPSAGSPSSISINDLYYYVGCNNSTPYNGYIEKYDIATRSYQAVYDCIPLSSRPDTAWSGEIAKFASSGVKYGDLVVLHQDGSFLDVWPVARFVDDLRLIEDGDLATGDYVGLRAPAAVTASYNLTFPAADPGATQHLYAASGGQLAWGQNLTTLASPTFVRLTLSQAIGTAPLTITSTTVVTNLNADQVDGKHEAAFVLVDGTRPLTASWDVGSFEVRAQTFQSDVATGTAPFTVASTTAVANLNADLLDGSHAAAFAAAGHNHSGVYEPVLGNPGTDGWVLSSTILGVRSWIAPGGGAGTFITLSDCPASYATHSGKFVKVNAGESALEFVASSVANHDLTSASHPDVNVAGLADNQILRYDSASAKWLNEDLPAASNHDVLSATHGDTLAAAVARGSVIVGNSTPKWSALAVGAVGTLLTSNGTDPSWTAPVEPGMFTLINESVDGLSTAALHGQGTYTYFGAWASTLVGTSTIAVVAHPVSGKMIQVTGDTVTEGSSYSAIVTTFQVGLGSGTRIRWKMRTSDVTVGTKGCAVGTAFGSEAAQVYFRSTGSKITFWNGTTNTDLMTAVNATWYQIDMIIIQGTTACYAYIFVDGVQQGAPKICAAVTVVVDTFWVYCNTTGTAAAVNLDVDDIQIGTNWFWNLVE